MEIQILNPIEYPGWDELLLTNDKTTFFHTTAWAKVLSESYNYKPLYFTIIEDNKLSSLIPVMEVKSLLTGKRGVSLPFTDECTPIFANAYHHFKINAAVIQHGKASGWKHLELRGGDGLTQAPHSSQFLSHHLNLTQGEEKLFSALRNSTKRNTKRAKKENVLVEILDTSESIETFYRLNCTTRKLHGLPPQPLNFFKKIFDHIISHKKGFVVLATFQEKVLAGAVFFQFANRVIYKYGASDRKYLNLRPNNLVMWEAIRWFTKNGFKDFSFGRTHPANSGLLQFKRGWGTVEKTIKYYKYDLKKNCFVSEKQGLKPSYNFFRHLPSPLLRLTGSLLYRHVG